MFAHLPKAIGCRALIVHYRRAPENVHPRPINDMAASYQWLLDPSIRPDRVALSWLDNAQKMPEGEAEHLARLRTATTAVEVRAAGCSYLR